MKLGLPFGISAMIWISVGVIRYLTEEVLKKSLDKSVLKDKVGKVAACLPAHNEEVVVAKSIKALRLYRSQVRQHPNPRSFEALKSLAHIRGSQSDSNLAEAFYNHKFLF